jgi:hypothetical protein
MNPASNIHQMRDRTLGSAIAALAMLATLFWRASDALLTPQFWAEDGAIFFQQDRLHGVMAIFIPYAGYLHFLPRFVAWAAHPFGAPAAPALYVATAVAVTLWSAVTIATTEIVYAWLLGAALLLVPHDGEIFATLANAQWLMAPALALALATPAPRSRLTRSNQMLFVGVAAFTGPFAIMAVPLALWRLVADARQYAKILAALVLIAATLQGATTLLSLAPAVGEITPPIAFALELADRWVGQLAHGGARSETIVQTAFAIAVVASALMSVIIMPREQRSTFTLLYVFATLILTSVWLKFLSGNQWNHAIDAKFFDRYFYVPRLVLLWGLVFCVVSCSQTWPRIVAMAILAVIAANAPAHWIKPHLLHMSWAQEARGFDREDGEALRIPINPIDWSVQRPAIYKSTPAPAVRT